MDIRKKTLTLLLLSIFSLISINCGGTTVNKAIKQQKNIKQEKVKEDIKPKTEQKEVFIPKEPFSVAIEEPLTGKTIYSEKISPSELRLIVVGNVFSYEEVLNIFPEKLNDAKKYINEKMTIPEGISFIRYYEDKKVKAKLMPYVKTKIKNVLTENCRKGIISHCSLLAMYFPEAKNLFAQKSAEIKYNNCLNGDVFSCYDYIKSGGKNTEKVKNVLIKDLNKKIEKLTNIQNFLEENESKVYIVDKYDFGKVKIIGVAQTRGKTIILLYLKGLNTQSNITLNGKSISLQYPSKKMKNFTGEFLIVIDNMNLSKGEILTVNPFGVSTTIVNVL